MRKLHPNRFPSVRQMIVESALRELNEWSSDIEMPELHARIDKENAERRERYGQYEEDDDSFFDWRPDGYRSPINSDTTIYATDKQQRKLDDVGPNVDKKFETLKRTIKRFFDEGANVLLNDEKFIDSHINFDKYEQEYRETHDENSPYWYNPLDKISRKAFPYMEKVYSKYTDEAWLSWWLLEYCVDYIGKNPEEVRRHLDMAWREISRHIDACREYAKKEEMAKARKSIGW